MSDKLQEIEEQPDSILNHYQHLIKFRNHHLVLAAGEIKFLDQGNKIVKEITWVGKLARGFSNLKTFILKAEYDIL